MVVLVLTSMAVSGQYNLAAPALFVDADFHFGELSQKFSSVPLSSSYPGLVDPSSNKIKFTDGNTKMATLECGYYLGQNKTFGIGAGINIQLQKGTVSVDSFHVEYSAVDYKGNPFRQLLTANSGINESVSGTNISIPVFACYRKSLSEDLFITASAGILYSLTMQYAVNSSPTFDYEAIYKFTGPSNNPQSVYDNAIVPDGSDWMITQKEYLKNNPNGNVSAYFSNLRTTGYSVGLGQSVKNTSESFSYSQKSIGFFLKASLNYKLGQRFFGKGGLYILSQSFKNATQNVQLVNPETGVYHSLMSYASGVTGISYGITFGIGMYFLYVR